MKGVNSNRRIFRYSAPSGAQVYDEPGRVRAALADHTTIQCGATWTYRVGYYDDGEQLADLSTAWSAEWSLLASPAGELTVLSITPTLGGAGNANPPNITVTASVGQTAALTTGIYWQRLTITSDGGEARRILEGIVYVTG